MFVYVGVIIHLDIIAIINIPVKSTGSSSQAGFPSRNDDVVLLPPRASHDDAGGPTFSVSPYFCSGFGRLPPASGRGLGAGYEAEDYRRGTAAFAAAG